MIYARSSTVWDIITDAANYTMWASGITGIEGDVRHGGTIRVRTRPGSKRAFRLRVRQVPGEVMTWTGGPALGLFTGVRTFTLSPYGGKTHLRVEDEFRGPLSRLFGGTAPDLGQDSTGYVHAVKERAELIG